MNLEDLIGLAISLLAFLYLMFRSAFRPMPKVQYEEEEEEEMPISAPLPPIQPQKKPAPVLPSKNLNPGILSSKAKHDNPYFQENKLSIHDKRDSIVSKQFEHAVAYDVIGKAQSSRARRILTGLKSKQEMVILKEILDYPKWR